MNTDTPTSDSSRKLAPVYLVMSDELILDAPIERAWPKVIDYPSWQKYSTVRHISGPVGQEGEVVLLKKEEPGATSFPPFLARTLKFAPPHQIIWKTYPETGMEAGEFFGIVEFTLTSVGNRTRWRTQLIYEFTIPYEDERELETFRKQQYENTRLMLSSTLPKLQRLCQE